MMVTFDSIDGVTKGKGSVFVKSVSASQLQTIAVQIENLALSDSLHELDTILAELNQVNT